MNIAHNKRLADAKKHTNEVQTAEKKRQIEAERVAKERQEQALKKNEEAKAATEEIKSEIQNYLDSDQQFDEGYALLVQYCSNVCLLAQVQRKRMHSKVIYELKKLIGKELIKPVRTILHNKPQRQVITLGNTVNQLRKDAPTIETELTPEQRKEALDAYLKESGSGINPDELPEEIKGYYEKACKYYHIFRHWHEVMKI